VAKPKYRTCLVSFFDLLGFSKMVEDRPPNEIASNVRRFHDTARIPREISEAFEAKSFQFSDSLVRMMPIDSRTNRKFPVGLLFHEINAIVLASIELANCGIPVRGGLTIGPAYFSGSTMFGPAMLRAYHLESRVAVYPRVVIDPVVIETLKSNPLLKKDTHDLYDEFDHLVRLIRRDADGVWFVDYLYNARDQTDTPEGYGRLLENNRKHIESTLRSRKQLDDVTIKSLWSAQYHNEVLDRLIRDGADPAKTAVHRITIPDALLGVLPDRSGE
jgi:hypothetical protein